MKRLVIALALAFGFVGLGAAQPAPASAAVQQWSQTSCSAIWKQLNYPVPFICLAEDADYGGSKLVLTGSSDIANLGTVTHTPVGYCNPKTQFDTDNWNDCITSVWGKLSTGDSFCMYHNSGYDWVFKRWFVGSSSNVTTFFDDDLGPTQSDTASSLMLQQSGPACNEGGV